MVVDLPDPYKLVGSRLEPIHEVLATQPPSLQTNIIRITRLMLERRDTINLRLTSSAKFTKPVRDPKTEEILKDKEDALLKFAPQSLRAKCPINSSSEFKDEPQMQALLLEAQTFHDEWKQKMAGTARQIAGLEFLFERES